MNINTILNNYKTRKSTDDLKHVRLIKNTEPTGQVRFEAVLEAQLIQII